MGCENVPFGLHDNDASAIRLVGAFFLLLGLLALPLLLAGCGSSVPAPAENRTEKDAATRDADRMSSPLRVKTADGEHILTVELALDRPSQERGLMFRRSMSADHGMLFIYHRERNIAMWMKNTILPLDMLFVRRDGTISKIVADTEPFSERIIPSDGPVYAVLELNAGTARRLAIRVGDRLIHPLLGAQ